MSTDIVTNSDSITSSLSEEQVDGFVKGAGSVQSIILWLVERTIPPQTSESVGPNHFWSWNRASDGLLKNHRADDAVEVCCAMYFAFLMLQAHFQVRLRKSMPLCNIGYMIGKTHKNRELQAKSWVLGIIEDVLTDPETVQERLSFRNLLSMRGAKRPEDLRLAAINLSTVIEIYFVEKALIPLFPEACVEVWLDDTSRGQVPGKPPVDRTRKSASEHCINNLNTLSQTLSKSYPKLPESENYLSLLAETWAFADWHKGVLGG